MQQLAAEQAHLAAELAADVQQARQQESIAPPEEQTLEGASWRFETLQQTLLQCLALKSGCRWHTPFYHAAGKIKQAVFAPCISIVLLER